MPHDFWVKIFNAKNFSSRIYFNILQRYIQTNTLMLYIAIPRQSKVKMKANKRLLKMSLTDFEELYWEGGK